MNGGFNSPGSERSAEATRDATAGQICRLTATGMNEPSRHTSLEHHGPNGLSTSPSLTAGQPSEPVKLSFKTNIQDVAWSRIAEFWRAGEDIDLFTAGWVNDHLYNPGFPDHTESTHSFEAFTTLAALAQVTSRLRLGTLVAANLFRHPAVVAKMAVTIDHISGGRFDLGLGAGWHGPEHTDHGIELTAPGPRLESLEEAVIVIRALLERGEASFAGSHYRLDGTKPSPQSVGGAIPIVIGGGGERRTLRIVAEHADHWNYEGRDPDLFAHKLAVLHQHCADVGRDPGEIEISAQLWVHEEGVRLRQAVDRAEGAGAEHCVISFLDIDPGLLESVAESLAPSA